MTMKNQAESSLAEIHSNKLYAGVLFSVLSGTAPVSYVEIWSYP